MNEFQRENSSLRLVCKENRESKENTRHRIVPVDIYCSRRASNFDFNGILAVLCTPKIVNFHKLLKEVVLSYHGNSV